MKRFVSSFIAMTLAIVMLFSTVSAFAGEMKFGLDVSKHNGVVDFVDAKDKGKSFVMIRIGYYDKLDEMFWTNVANAVNAGMDFGVYLYSYAYSVDEARVEADFVINTLAQMPEEYKQFFTLPVAYDLEDASIASKCSREQINQQMSLFCDSVRSVGYVPMVYANTNWFTKYIDINTVVSQNYKIWYAYWNSAAPDFSNRIMVGNTGVYADMWQYIDDNDPYASLDKNVIYDSDALIKPLHIHSYTNSFVDATCYAGGYTIASCSTCGYQYVVSTTPALNHYYQVSSTKSASYTEKGYTIYTCALCGDSYKVDIDKKAPKMTSLAKGTKSFTAKWKKVSSLDGYQLQYATDKKFSKNKKSITINKKSTVTYKATKLKAKKTYYVRVRGYKIVKGKKVYSSWSNVKSVKTK